MLKMNDPKKSHPEAKSAPFTPYAMNERTIFPREFRCQK